MQQSQSALTYHPHRLIWWVQVYTYATKIVQTYPIYPYFELPIKQEHKTRSALNSESRVWQRKWLTGFYLIFLVSKSSNRQQNPFLLDDLRMSFLMLIWTFWSHLAKKALVVVSASSLMNYFPNPVPEPERIFSGIYFIYHETGFDFRSVHSVWRCTESIYIRRCKMLPHSL